MSRALLTTLLIWAPLTARADLPPPTSTLQRLATTLHDQLAELALTMPRPAVDLVLCMGGLGDAPAPGVDASPSGSERLLVRIEAILAGAAAADGYRSVHQLGNGRKCASNLEEAATQAEQRGAEALLHVVSTIQAGRLLLEGTLLRTDRSLWRDLQGGHPRGIIGQLFASARLDAELRFYLGRPVATPSKRSAEVVWGAPGEVLALAVSDLDSDDLEEIAVLRRRSLDLLALRGQGRAQLVASFPLDSLPPAATASRDPIGSMALVAAGRGGRIALRVSDYASGLLVSWDGERFGPTEPLGDYPFAAPDGLVCAVAPRGRNTFDPRLAPCSAVPGLAPPEATGPLWSLSFGDVLQPDGSMVRSVAHALADARLLVTVGQSEVDLGSAGSVVLAADLDDDGIVEVARSSASMAGDPDRVTVTSVGPSGPREFWDSGPIGGPVAALAAGDVDGDGVLELLVAETTPSGSRIWIVE